MIVAASIGSDFFERKMSTSLSFSGTSYSVNVRKDVQIGRYLADFHKKSSQINS